MHLSDNNYNDAVKIVFVYYIFLSHATMRVFNTLAIINNKHIDILFQLSIKPLYPTKLQGEITRTPKYLFIFPLKYVIKTL